MTRAIRTRGVALAATFFALGVGCDGASAPVAREIPTAGSASESSSPSPPADAHGITFTSRRDGYWSIYSIDRHGSLEKIVDVTPVDAGPKEAWLDLLGQPAWSPDGTRLAFTCTHTNRSEVCVLDEGAEEPRVLTGEAGDADTNPVWAPDGQRLFFSSFRKGHYDLYSMRTDGTGKRLVVGGRGNQSNAHPSSDGRLLSYVQNRGKRWTLEIVRLGRRGPATVESLRDAYMGVWSPTGRDLAFTKARDERFLDLFILSFGTGETRRLTRSPGLDSSPAFSPDGRMVAFTRDTGFTKDGYTVSDVYMVDIATREITQLTDDPATDMQTTWRPE